MRYAVLRHALGIADFAKSKAQGGPYLFKSDSYLPSDACKGDLAEAWKWLENPLRLEVKLRKGVMFPDKPGVMAARELTAQDVVYSYTRLLASAKRLPDFLDHVDKVEGPDKHTVVIHFKNFHENWGYRLGWGVFSSVYPKEVVDAGISDWQKANGSGPFQLAEYVNGNSQNYVKNPFYWGKEKIARQEYKLPFVDRVSIRIMKDEAARYAALRTAKLDVLQSITWTAAEELKKNVPQLKWARWLQHRAPYIAMRTDTKPFDDVRVRRALNMAVNKHSQWNDPTFERKMQAMFRERDEPTRQKMVREMTREILEKAPYIWLPTAYTYAAW